MPPAPASPPPSQNQTRPENHADKRSGIPYESKIVAVGIIRIQATMIRWAPTRPSMRRREFIALVGDLVRLKVTVIAAAGTPAALAAKAATAVIPIVFETAGDPVTLGLVASLNQPGRNVTGLTQLNSELVPKRLGLLHDLIPTAKIIGLLVNQKDPRAETQSSDMQEAARALGLQIHLLNASTEAEIDTAFASLVQLRAGALIVGTGTFFTTRRNNSRPWPRDIGC